MIVYIQLKQLQVFLMMTVRYVIMKIHALNLHQLQQKHQLKPQPKLLLRHQHLMLQQLLLKLKQELQVLQQHQLRLLLKLKRQQRM